MANSKISALTSATTPLAGTETLPIVQGGATVKTTVANITNGGGYAGSFTTLASTGNTTLGDASTDTVRVNGYMGVGGAANIANALTVGSPTLSGTTQRGIDSATTFGTGATASVQQIRAISTLTTAGAYTEWIGLNVPQPQGTGYTLTNAYGLYISDQTKGTNNYGITSLVSSGTNKWNIYASGTAANYFAGGVNLGATTNPGAGNLSLTGNVVIGTSGKGIDFSATAGTGTSELFNDYEEGTWTPAITPSAGSITTLGTTVGNYTKVGNTVYAWFNSIITTNGTGSGSIRIAGLPFSASTSDAFTGTGTEVAVSGKALRFAYVGTTTAGIAFYDNTYPGANSARFLGVVIYTT